jgi:hypothetical protein
MKNRLLRVTLMLAMFLIASASASLAMDLKVVGNQLILSGPVSFPATSSASPPRSRKTRQSILLSYGSLTAATFGRVFRSGNSFAVRA